ncbi:signal peptidase I [Myceligenerans xiligouense]|uniref:signal peptidase I n=1 Tax=Myceligenerans xiligouense TaxID=253184 RepID=UPI001FEC2E93|nr:signal peptidase I [Myceligenerans xiligouense]
MTTYPVAQHAKSPRRSPKEQSGGLAVLKEIAIIVISALVLSFLIKTFLVQSFYIPSASMEDTLITGDRVMVSRLTPGLIELERGDIVVFVDPGGWLQPYVPPDRGPVGNAITAGLTVVGLLPSDTGEHLIKRAIGLPGDHVECDAECADSGGPVRINGVPIDESLYVKAGNSPSGGKPFDVTVPDDMLFVMGDHRQSSSDSRFNTSKPGGGFVPVDNVVGTAFSTVWPLDRMEWHSNPDSVFTKVPDATGPAPQTSA